MKTTTKPAIKQLLLIALVSLMANAFLPAKSVAQDTNPWTTYCGGTGDEAQYTNVATDPSGNVYIVGETESTILIAAGGFQNVYGGGKEAYIMKFDAAGNRLWSSYYGGNGDEAATGVATDLKGNVYMMGTTNGSSGLASTHGYQLFSGGGVDNFLVKFDASGSRLWATYYGGNSDEGVGSVATDTAGNVYIGSTTKSANDIASPGAYQTAIGAGADGYLAKFDASGKRIWATYYGGFGDESGRANVATDLTGNVYLAGTTTSSFGIALGGFQTVNGGGVDAFLVKFNSAGFRLWGTYYGGSGDETGKQSQSGTSVATDRKGNVFLAGNTNSLTQITYNNTGYQSVFMGGDFDAFLVKFDSNGVRLWSTYYGGTDDDEVGSVATDAAGNAYLGGETASSSNIASGGKYPTKQNGVNGFIATFDSAGGLYCSTYEGQDFHIFNAQIATTKAAFTAKVSANGTTCGQLDGQASVTISGGGGPYTYVWSTNPVQTTRSITGLSAGNYTVTITDNSGVSIYMSAITKSTSSIAHNGFQNVYGGGTSDAFLAKFTTCAKTSTSIVKTAVVLGQGSGSAGNITAIRDTICSGTRCSLTLHNNSGSVQWQSATTQPNFTIISGVIDTLYSEVLTQTTYFRAIAGTGACADTSKVYTIYVPPVLVAKFGSSTSGNDISFNSDASIGSIVSYNWDFGDNTTSLEKNPVHTYATSDTFNVCLTVYDGSNCSYTFCRNVISGLNGVENIAAQDNWDVYPVPFSDYILIRNKGVKEKIQSVEIYDLLGRTVLYKEMNDVQNNSLKLDVASLPQGMFYVKIRTAGANYVQQVIKQ